MIESIYFHIPFCKRICSYCDFCKNYYKEDIVSKYLIALKNEFLNNYKNEKIKTVYIGGGTPSCLNYDNLNCLFSITNKINLSSRYEFTFECNYDDITEELLKILKENKVNRISIGIESFNKKFEDILGRKIDKEEMIKNINLCKKYFDNINIDLMYALYGQTLEDIVFDLNIISNLDIKHVSIYALIIEDNTMLKIKNIKEVDSEMQSAMYYLIRNELEKNGFNQYEISNFALKGFESKHNLTYWNNDNYYGFGSGASGFINNIRYDNTKSVFKYINGITKIYTEKLDKNMLINDEVMLNLRKTTGINKKHFFNKYGKKINDLYSLNELIKDGYLKETKEYIYIPKKYLFVSNEIILKVLE